MRPPPPGGSRTRRSHQLRGQRWCWDVMPGLLPSRPGYSANGLAPGHPDQPAPAPAWEPLLPPWAPRLRAAEGPRDSDELSPEHPGSWEPGPHSLVSVGSLPQLVGSDPPGEVEEAHGVLEVEVRHRGILDGRAEPRGQRGQAEASDPEPRPLRIRGNGGPARLRGWSACQRPERGLEAAGLALSSALRLLGPGLLSPQGHRELGQASDASRRSAVPGMLCACASPVRRWPPAAEHSKCGSSGF